MSNTEVAEAQSAGFPTQLSEDFEQMSGAGFEDADQDSFAIPFLAILQSGSPQVKRTDHAFIDGAEEGMLIDTVEQEIIKMDEGIQLIPCHFRRAFIEWGLRELGGGYVQEHATDNLPKTERDDKNRDIIVDNGNHLVDTRYHYVLRVMPDGELRPYVIGMSSTQVKKSKRWMQKMQNIKFQNSAGKKYIPPSFSHIYTLGVVPEQKDDNSWWNWDIGDKQVVTDREVIEQAKAFHDAVASGSVKEAVNTQETVEGSETDAF